VVEEVEQTRRSGGGGGAILLGRTSLPFASPSEVALRVKKQQFSEIPHARAIDERRREMVGATEVNGARFFVA